MSYKQKFVTAIAAGFAVVSFSAFASAQTDATNGQPQDSTQKQEKRERRGGFGRHDGEEGRGGHRHGGGKMRMRELGQLNLTDAQKQQIRTIMETSRADGKNSQNFEEIRTLVQAKRDGTITPEQKERLKSFKQQMRQKSEATHQQILAILTAEQRAQLEQLKEKRRAEMKERREMRGNKSQSDKQDNDDN